MGSSAYDFGKGAKQTWSSYGDWSSTILSRLYWAFWNFFRAGPFRCFRNTIVAGYRVTTKGFSLQHRCLQWRCLLPTFEQCRHGQCKWKYYNLYTTEAIHKKPFYICYLKTQRLKVLLENYLWVKLSSCVILGIGLTEREIQDLKRIASICHQRILTMVTPPHLQKWFSRARRHMSACPLIGQNILNHLGRSLPCLWEMNVEISQKQKKEKWSKYWQCLWGLFKCFWTSTFPALKPVPYFDVLT